MNNFGVTPYGFRRKTYNECLADKLTKAREVFGVNIDTSETSFLGLLIRNAAWEDSIIWEYLEEVYYSPFVNTAEGTSLDNVGMYLTITRRPAIKSKGILKIKGDEGLIIPKGFLVSDEKNEKLFETLEDVKIVNGEALVPIQSVGAGKKFNTEKETLTKIVNPILGVDSVLNIEATDNGLDVETDDEFRSRYKESYARVGGSTVPAITAALLDTKGVIDAEVVENTSMVEVDGIPPKAFECFVYGGDEKDIIMAIYQNKAAGIEAFGETFVDVEDMKGKVHKIGYTRAQVVDVWVKLEITPDENFKGIEAAKRAVLNYIGGFDIDNIEYNGLSIGKDVTHSKLVSSVMCPGGVLDVKASISTDGQNFTETTLDIAKYSIARTSWDRVLVYVL